MLRLLPLTLAAAVFSACSPAEAAPREPAAPRLCKAAVQAIDQAAAKTLRQGSPGMIIEVAQHGELLFSGAYGHADLEQQQPVSRDSVFKLASITKQFTAAIMLTLADEGKLDLQDPVTRHVPELAVASKVRLYDLLVQASGIPDYSDDPAGDKTKSVAKTSAEMIAWIAALTPRLQFEPGTRWAYSNSNYVLLGLVAERVTGQPLAKMYHDRLFTPAGMTATRLDDPGEVVPFRVQGYRRAKDAPSGFRNADWISPTIPGAAGGLRGTAADLVRWNNALFGGRVLSPRSLRSLISPGRLSDGRTTKLGMPEDWQKGLNSDYGMGVFIRPTPAGDRIGHSGDISGFATWAAHYPATGVTIVQMINSQSADLNVEAVEAAVFSGGRTPCLE